MQFDLIFDDPAWNVSGSFTGDVTVTNAETGSYWVHFPSADVVWSVEDPITGITYSTSGGYPEFSVVHIENNQVIDGYLDIIGPIDGFAQGTFNSIYFSKKSGGAFLTGGGGPVRGDPHVTTPFYGYQGPSSLSISPVPDGGSTGLLGLFSIGTLGLMRVASVPNRKRAAPFETDPKISNCVSVSA